MANINAIIEKSLSDLKDEAVRADGQKCFYKWFQAVIDQTNLTDRELLSDILKEFMAITQQLHDEENAEIRRNNIYASIELLKGVGNCHTQLIKKLNEARKILADQHECIEKSSYDKKTSLIIFSKCAVENRVMPVFYVYSAVNIALYEVLRSVAKNDDTTISFFLEGIWNACLTLKNEVSKNK